MRDSARVSQISCLPNSVNHAANNKRKTISRMTDMTFNSFPSSQPAEAPQIAPAPAPVASASTNLGAIGRVIEISGGGARIQMEGHKLREIAKDPDPSVALSGQVGSQIKLESGSKWLLANV